MRWLKTIAAEIVGLFVEDGTFALVIFVWLCMTWTILPRLGVLGGWKGVILVIGLFAILVESVLRAARK